MTGNLRARNIGCWMFNSPNFPWQTARGVLTRACSLKAMDACPSRSQSGDREPRENRGRLRHCYGLQTPTGHWSRTGKAGARSNPKSGYRSGCARRGPALRDQLLRQEKDEASPFRSCGRNSLNAFIPVLPEGEGFLFGVRSSAFRRFPGPAEAGTPNAFPLRAGLQP